MSPEKWCSGPCGRLLPREAFDRNVHGHSQGRCRACRRIDTRTYYRRKRRRCAAFRRSERARLRAWRAANRERIAAYNRAYYLWRKTAA